MTFMSVLDHGDLLHYLGALRFFLNLKGFTDRCLLCSGWRPSSSLRQFSVCFHHTYWPTLPRDTLEALIFGLFLRSALRVRTELVLPLLEQNSLNLQEFILGVFTSLLKHFAAPTLDCRCFC
ncbi:hypothetical protein XENORESO_010980 [Xenotaenia resolanae]|uniref:Uncharacterized protein n=1 Tax=Xenotaenia resolanae TaxID=208358 RepID=A0ABV0WEG8_9TELE